MVSADIDFIDVRETVVDDISDLGKQV